MNLLTTESFEDTFGKKATRKRPRLLAAADAETLVKVATEKSGNSHLRAIGYNCPLCISRCSLYCGDVDFTDDYEQVLAQAKLTQNELPDFKGSARQRMFEKG